MNIFAINKRAGKMSFFISRALFFFKNIKRMIVFINEAMVKARAMPFPPMGPTKIKARRILTAKQIIPAIVGDFESFWA